MLCLALSMTSTLPTKLSTWTLLLKPLVMLMLCVLFRGNPEPSPVTEPPDIEQPAIFKLAASIGTLFARRSAIALGMLSAQSAAIRVGAMQLTDVPTIGTIDGLVTPPKELPTL